MKTNIINPQIKVNPDTLLELMFDSARYCIGSRTGHAAMMAQDIWHIIRFDRDKFNEDRLQFFARDIRAEISQFVGGWQNCKVTHAYNDCIKYDAYTLLCKYLEAHPDEVFGSCDFEIDCVSGEVKCYDGGVESSAYSPYPYDGLPQWIMLANCIDRQLEITLSDGKNKDTRICVEAPTNTYDEQGHYVNRAKFAYHRVENWALMAPKEYIKEFKPL